MKKTMLQAIREAGQFGMGFDQIFSHFWKDPDLTGNMLELIDEGLVELGPSQKCVIAK